MLVELDSTSSQRDNVPTNGRPRCQAHLLREGSGGLLAIQPTATPDEETSMRWSSSEVARWSAGPVVSHGQNDLSKLLHIMRHGNETLPGKADTILVGALSMSSYTSSQRELVDAYTTSKNKKKTKKVHASGSLTPKEAQLLATPHVPRRVMVGKGYMTLGFSRTKNIQPKEGMIQELRNLHRKEVEDEITTFTQKPSLEKKQPEKPPPPRPQFTPSPVKRTHLPTLSDLLDMQQVASDEAPKKRKKGDEIPFKLAREEREQNIPLRDAPSPPVHKIPRSTDVNSFGWKANDRAEIKKELCTPPVKKMTLLYEEEVTSSWEQAAIAATKVEASQPSQSSGEICSPLTFTPFQVSSQFMKRSFSPVDVSSQYDLLDQTQVRTPPMTGGTQKGTIRFYQGIEGSQIKDPNIRDNIMPRPKKRRQVVDEEEVAAPQEQSPREEEEEQDVKTSPKRKLAKRPFTPEESPEQKKKKKKNVEDDGSEEDLDEGEKEVRKILMGEGADSSESEGEDLEENLERDEAELYENPELDEYDKEMLDEEDYGMMDADARMKAELEIRRRQLIAQNRKLKKGTISRQPSARVPSALIEEDEEEEITDRLGPVRRRQLESLDILADLEDLEDLQVEEVEVNLEDQKGPLKTWVMMPAPKREIARQLNNFLRSTLDDRGRAIYRDRIHSMVIANAESLEVNYKHLQKFHKRLAMWITDAPTQMLQIFDETAYTVILEHFPEYQKIRREVRVRVTDLPIIDSLRDIRNIHLNNLIRTAGVVTRRTSVFPQLKAVKYNCGRCAAILGPYTVDDSQETVRISQCPECQSRGPFNINTEQTIYRNYQRMTLQESPGTVPAGRLPRTKEIILIGDLIDSARPGEEVDITGIYKNNFDVSLNSQNGFPVFATIIEANSIIKREDAQSAFRLTEEDERAVRELAKDERIGEKLVQSIAPSIFGHDDIKTALCLALFGGVSKNVGEHRLRGDINVLLLGDPGVAKSQFLKYVEKTASRAVYSTGQGASAVGLTAGVRKDPVTREWTLEGGALVLADQGVCLIDEFDKMNDKDRTSIHEAMEQQTISISKAGIVTTLQARCSVIAAANPLKGRYDTSLSFAKNVDLTEPILSRFDVVNPVTDEQLATFVVESHAKSHPEFQGDKMLRVRRDDIIDQDMLKKYILYAKRKCQPKMSPQYTNKLAELFKQMRKQSRSNLSGGGVMITVRHLESTIRMAEAHARMHLRDHVREEDINMAIRVALDSFVSAQQFSVSKVMRKRFHQYLTYKRDYNDLLLHVLQNLLKDAIHFHQIKYGNAPDTADIPVEDLQSRSAELGITDLSEFYSSDLFKKNNFHLDRSSKVIKKIFV
ncbi:hypothetical protein PROFUN_05796 [Planoprotostelium fungivorum]|uniref:DNA replication licensing factor MCM2 n=1 Tax=Planoprotostelium fungivorum TaxID=1890364 RepID=A0A2P6NQ01_9EUKA|nr:hypothetical protein PROFUN_05796 [Planoprotostelium fungivorum]